MRAKRIHDIQKIPVATRTNELRRLFGDLLSEIMIGWLLFPHCGLVEAITHLGDCSVPYYRRNGLKESKQ